MMNYTERQCNNMLLGLTGFLLLDVLSSYTGNWYAVRLYSTNDVIINGISLTNLDEYWNAGLYFFADVTSITTGKLPVLAYNTGLIETLKS